MKSVTFCTRLESFSHVSINRKTTSGLLLNLLTAVCIPGKEAMQGPHQVAQKSTTTTFPLREERATSFPLMSFKANCGAGMLIMLFANSAFSLLYAISSRLVTYAVHCASV